LEILGKFKSINAKGFYTTNKISVRGATQEVVDALLERDDIQEIRLAKVLSIGAVVPQQERVLEWGVGKINAPEAWEAGFTGVGVVASSIDTGVR
jgi:bacillopeptidase F